MTITKALADPNRVRVLLALDSAELCVCQLVELFGRAPSTVSKHLSILTECELLKQEQNGREMYYHLNPKKMKEIADFIEPFRNMWDDSFNKLESIMKKYKSKK